MNQVRPDRQQRSSSALKPLNLVNRIREARQLYRREQQDTGEHVFTTISSVQQCSRLLLEHFGLTLGGLEILEIGPGPRLEHMRALCVLNEVTGIDRDIVLQGTSLRDCVELFRSSPALEAAKTVTRKLLSWDRLFEKTLAGTLGVQRFPRLNVLRMDATRMTFPEASFDLVCSWSAFEQSDKPQAALAEVVRVLRPGGVAYLSTRLDTGRNEAWKQVFQDAMPGVRFIPERQEPPTGFLISLWQKPPAGPA